MAHHHAALIHKWADGAQIEVMAPDGRWHPCQRPNWEPDVEYRVAPAPLDPFFMYGTLNGMEFRNDSNPQSWVCSNVWTRERTKYDNIRALFIPGTGPTSVELIYPGDGK